MGCLSQDETEPGTAIAFLELENHQRERGYEFTVRIEDGEEVAFEESRRLEPAGSGDDAVAFDDPVPPGTYTVSVDVDEHSAVVEMEELTSTDEPCLGFRFYLGPETLHVEHRSYDRCG